MEENKKTNWKKIGVIFIVISILLLVLTICMFLALTWYIKSGSVPIEDFYDASCAATCLTYGYDRFGVYYDENKLYDYCACDTPRDDRTIISFGNSIKIDRNGNVIKRN